MNDTDIRHLLRKGPMFQYAAACFAILLVTSFMGFGGMVDSAVALTKALAVVFLVLFFASLFKGLYESEPPHSAS